MPASTVRMALSDKREAERTHRSWWSILKASGSEWMDADAMTWAAAIACYAVLALAPLLVVAVKVATVFLRGQEHAVQMIHENAGKWMGSSQAADAIGTILERIINQKSGLLAAIISGVLVVVSVGGVYAEIQQAMNRVWKLKPRPGGALWAFVQARLKSIVVLGVGALVLLASIGAAAWIAEITSGFGAAGRVLAWIAEFVGTIVAMTIIFGLVFKTVPDAKIGWKTTMLGALLTAILFALGKYGLAMYFKYAAPTSAFGAVGSLAAVLIWIYYSAQIVLFGAVVTQVYSKRRGHGVRPDEHAQFLSECDETETATPSSEEPGNKPTRPTPTTGRSPAGGSRGRAVVSDPGYAAVLSPYVSSPAGRSPRRGAGIPATAPAPVGYAAGPDEAVVRNLVIAGAGAVMGAIVGGLGALRLDRPRRPDPRQLADARLRRRLNAVQRTVSHASGVKQYLEREDVNEQLDRIREQIRASRIRRIPRRAVPEPWTARVAEAMKSYL